MMKVAISVLLAVVAAWAGPVEAQWPMYRADAARSGYTSERLPAGLELSWTYRATQPPTPAWPTRTRLRYDVALQPIVAQGRLYFGSSADGKVYALDAAKGRQAWEFFTAGPVRFAPAFSEGRLLAASDDGHLYALDAVDGRLLWKVRGGPRGDMLLGNDRMVSRWPARGGPVIADGTVYFGAGIWPSEGIFLYAVDPASGRVKWCNDSSGSLEMDQPHPTARAKSGVAVQGYLAAQLDALIVPTGRAVPAVFDRKDGTLRYFHLQDNTHQGGSDVVAIDREFFNDTSVFSLDDGGSFGRTGLAVAAHPEYVVASAVGRLTVHDRRNLFVERWVTDRKGEKKKAKSLAKPLWSLELPEGFGLKAPSPKGSGTPEGKQMGSTGYASPSIEGQPGSLIVAGDWAVIGGRDQVIAIDLPARKIAWKAAVEGSCCGLAVAEGRLYASTDRGVIHCFAAGGERFDAASSSGATGSQADGVRDTGPQAAPAAQGARSLCEKTNPREKFVRPRRCRRRKRASMRKLPTKSSPRAARRGVSAWTWAAATGGWPWSLRGGANW